MSRSLIRLSLWALFGVLGIALLREIFDSSPLGALPSVIFQRAFIGAGILLGLGVALLAVEKLFGTPSGRCVTCRARVTAGEFYCKAHLREILEEEDNREHKTGLRD